MTDKTKDLIYKHLLEQTELLKKNVAVYVEHCETNSGQHDELVAILANLERELATVGGYIVQGKPDWLNIETKGNE